MLPLLVEQNVLIRDEVFLNTQLNLGPSVSAFYSQFSIVLGRPVSHALQAVSGLTHRWIKTPAIVFNYQTPVCIRFFELNSTPGCSTVFYHVTNGFLCNAEQVSFDRLVWRML